ncbi:MAG: PspC domain-containing protein [Flavobacteriaceae bacterium]|nr:PspC domain-containing protein [Flavobacteriaceae bacterium]
MMANRKIFIRGENRIVGGVCSSISEKYNFPNWILRTIFVVTSIVFYFPIIIYLIIWLIIPNRKVENISKKRKYSLQALGFFIGGIIGWYAGYYLGLIAIDGNKSEGLVLSIFAFVGIPIGTIIGFSTSRIIAEKKLNSK